MNEAKIYMLLYILITLCFAGASFFALTLSTDKDMLIQENYALKTKLEQFEMYYLDKYSADFEYDNGINGLAFPDKHIFMVYTKDRSLQEIINTCYHEIGHMKLNMGHRSDIEDLEEQLAEAKAEVEKLKETFPDVKTQ